MVNCKLKTIFLSILFVFISIPVFQNTILAQGVKRVVIIKVDGLPGDYVDRFVKERHPKTGKSQLPWIEEVFYKNGTRLANFYTRGMSLSAPSWSILDTGQYLQLKGNVEYDRYTLHAYDYLNFIPFYIDYGLKKRADMPGVEVLDSLRVPLLIDAFPYQQRYTSYQLFQRGIEWEILAKGFTKLFPKNPRDLIDEWTIGFDFRDTTINQHEHDIITQLSRNPENNYFDFYHGSFDHISHHNNDRQSRLNVLKELDRTIGKIWMGILESPRADETALIIVSDHGVNSDEKIYSQGFNIVKFLAGADGGGHHVITKRRLMLDYSIKGINPLVPLITTTSNNSYYLKNQSSYPTALVDFDGNERSSLHFRENDLNVLHILLQQLQSGKLSPVTKAAATKTFFDLINSHRAKWQKTFDELNEELSALHRWTVLQQSVVQAMPKKVNPDDTGKGLNVELVREAAKVEVAEREEIRYREYVSTLSNLLSLSPENFDAAKIKIEDYIPKGTMGERNSVYALQNYVVGLSPQGLSADANGGIDFEKSFKRVNYFKLIQSQKVLNNVQPEISSQPIDFVATNIPVDLISPSLQPDQKTDEDPIWLYGGTDKQALILAREDDNGNRSFRYLPVANLTQSADGTFSFQTKEWDKGFPLKIFEDPNLNIPVADKISWLSDWHTELEWLKAIHKCLYSNALIGLNEQLDNHPLKGFEVAERSISEDEKLIHRFRARQRRITQTDLLLLASNHWNFDVRGFNPGGNHGSFFRVSTNSTLMMAGGATSNIPRGLVIEEPYDSLSFVPTVLRLMGKVGDDNQPIPDLYKKGFRKFPGRLIKEITAGQTAGN
jgi:hypothetical protein